VEFSRGKRKALSWGAKKKGKGVKGRKAALFPSRRKKKLGVLNEAVKKRTGNRREKRERRRTRQGKKWRQQGGRMDPGMGGEWKRGLPGAGGGEESSERGRDAQGFGWGGGGKKLLAPWRVEGGKQTVFEGGGGSSGPGSKKSKFLPMGGEKEEEGRGEPSLFSVKWKGGQKTFDEGKKKQNGKPDGPLFG